MLRYEQAFGNVSERRKSKYCGVLMKNCRKVNGEKSPNASVTKTQKY